MTIVVKILGINSLGLNKYNLNLGYTRYSGNGFQEKYGQAIYVPNLLEEIINIVDDIELLGSAIYSTWRYFNHWAYDGHIFRSRKSKMLFISIK